MRNYSKIINAFFGSEWAIQIEKLEAMLEFLNCKNAGIIFSAEQIQERISSGSEKTAFTSGQIAVLPLVGVISSRMDLMESISGGQSAETFGRQFDAAVNDADIAAIIIDIESPGGTVQGVQELAAKIYAARGRKKIIAVANSFAASAAYWIGAAADEFVITPSGEVGSIGVYTLHLDESEADKQEGLKYTFISAGKFKIEGNSTQPLGDEAKAYYQGRVDARYETFTGDVAKFRGVSKTDVKNNFGQGRMLLADDAKKAGMVDRIATLDEVIEELMNKKTKKSSTKSRAQMEREHNFAGLKLSPKSYSVEKNKGS